MTGFLGAAVRGAILSVFLLPFFACPSQSAGPPPKSSEADAAATLVRAALEKELAGRNDERDALLQEAVRKSPDLPAVRWQLGEVRGDDKNEWLTTAQVEAAALKDRRLAEYRQRRDAAGSTLPEQIELAKWCRKNKLDSEERLHWLFVLQMQPNHPDAIQRLGLINYKGMLLTNEQIAKLKEQAECSGKALEVWRPLAAHWQQSFDLGETEMPREMKEKIATISQWGEMVGMQRAIWQQILGKKHMKEQTQAWTLSLARALRDNPHPVAADCLTHMALCAEAEDVRACRGRGLETAPVGRLCTALLASLQNPIDADTSFNLDGNGNLVARQRASRRRVGECDVFQALCGRTSGQDLSSREARVYRRDRHADERLIFLAGTRPFREPIRGNVG